MKKFRNTITSRLACLAGVLLLAGMASCTKNAASSGNGPLIVLASDLGSRDAYVGQMKGSLLAINPAARIVDLNHDIQTSNMAEASYLFDRSAAFFPAGTIFVVTVESGTGALRKPVLIHTREGKYYLGPDNGIFTHVMEREQVDQAFELNVAEYFRPGEVSPNFQGRDIFGPVAAHLAAGVDFTRLGTKLKEITRLKLISPAVLGNKTNGQVIHIDRYGNIITNIRADGMSNQAKGKLLKISFKGRTISSPFLNTYAEAPPERVFCFINSEGEFEIALRDGNAAAAGGLKAGDPITVQY